MEQERFEAIYKLFGQLSAFDANVYMCEAVDRALEAEGVAPEEIRKSRDSLLRMQLASGQFKEMVERNKDTLLSHDEGAAFTAFISNILDQQLKDKTPAERRAIIVDMIGKAFDLAQEPLSEDETLLLSCMNDQILEKSFQDTAKALATDLLQRSFSEMDLESQVVDADIPPNASVGFLEDAGACAVYVSDASLRTDPEMIGITSAAVATCTDLAKGFSEENYTLNLVEAISMVLMQIALLFIITLLLSATLYTGGAAIGLMLAEEAVTLPMIGELFVELVGVFTAELKVAFGIGVVSALVTAFTQILRIGTLHKLISALRPHKHLVAIDANDGLNANFISLSDSKCMEEDKEMADYNDEEEEPEYAYE